MQWKSCAKWPAGSVTGLGGFSDTTSDTHDTKEQAEAVCKMLCRHGFGGDGALFPVETWVEMVLDERTLKALNESIEHWERLVAGVRGERIGSVTCPLCRAFAHAKAIDDCCQGCPVKEHTGKQFCQGTPWDEIELMQDYGEDAEKTPEFPAIAKRELAFLKSLLPRTTTTTKS